MRVYKDETRADYKDVIFVLESEKRIVCYNENALRELMPQLENATSLEEYEKLKENAQVGFCSFSVSRDGECWLNLIQLENQEFKRYGIPSIMLMLMEKRASRRGAYYVEGKYIPKSDGTEEFYAKNGYKIASDGYRSVVEKSLHSLNYDHLKKHTDDVDKIELSYDELIKTLPFYEQEDEYTY